ncbi:MAG: MGMT family protein [Turicibacter sp.]|nr:MGMT family protein [Turicibacter sp.]
MAKLDEDFLFAVLEAIAEIPYGKVATYGQIATLIGKERNARLVGKALQISGLYADGYPCYRVVNSSGRLAPGFDAQEALLKEEGVAFKENGHVDLKNYQWGA